MTTLKKKRTKKTSKGIHGGGGKTRLTELEKALIAPSYTDQLAKARKQRSGK